MNEQPRTLKAMLAHAKDTSELMLDLAYAGLFYADRDLSGEVLELEEELSRLVHRMREVCLMASRSPQDAAGLA
ncbi:MAG TPA: PhoU domain-containing protein, partial [Actinomycetota bacterium]|nr:PhoU domain-containing protein [Actinomycetota bacterium]